MRAAIARPVPVLPDVGSMIVPPGRSRPSRSAASIRRIATRSLIDPPGLKYSTFATTCGATPAAIRDSRTSGVFPTVSRVEAIGQLWQTGQVPQAVDPRREQVLAAAHADDARERAEEERRPPRDRHLARLRAVLGAEQDVLVVAEPEGVAVRQ